MHPILKSYLLVEGCAQFFILFNFFLGRSHFDWSHHIFKKNKHWALPQNRSTKVIPFDASLSKIKAHRCFHQTPPLQYIYLYESSTLAKAYGLKVWCYWEHLGNTLELDGNTLGIARKPKKKTLFTPPAQHPKQIGPS